MRGFRAWYRHVTLALLAHAVLAVLRAQAHVQEKSGAGQDCIRLSVAEVRRIIQVLREPEEVRAFRLGWSQFRRHHQAEAKRCHIQRRARQAPLAHSQAREAIAWPGLPRLTDAKVGSGFARSCHLRSLQQVALLSIIAWWWKGSSG